MIQLPPMFTMCRNDRWLIVAVDDWSLAAGRVFDRQVIRLVDLAPAEQNPLARGFSSPELVAPYPDDSEQITFWKAMSLRYELETNRTK